MADDELDAMMADLDAFSTQGTTMPTVINGEVQIRHNEREAKKLLRDIGDEDFKAARAPTMEAVVRTSVGTCFVCSKVIDTAGTSSTYTSMSDGTVVHDDCYKCGVCRREITSGFKKTGSSLTCADCLPKDRCKRCRGDIQATETFLSPEDGVFFHSNCTSCGSCKKRLQTSEAYWLKGDLYCEKCAPV